VPTATFLEDVAPGAAASTSSEGENAPTEPPSEQGGSLGIGSLKKEPAGE